MKNSGIIIGSLIGGAILGSAITMCIAAKYHKKVGVNIHEMILKKLEKLHSHCHCDDDETCTDESCQATTASNGAE